jgi:hypothetical protein
VHTSPPSQTPTCRGLMTVMGSTASGPLQRAVVSITLTWAVCSPGGRQVGSTLSSKVRGAACRRSEVGAPTQGAVGSSERRASTASLEWEGASCEVRCGGVMR